MSHTPLLKEDKEDDPPLFRTLALTLPLPLLLLMERIEA